jgi:PRC-barrel domain protein
MCMTSVFPWIVSSGLACALVLGGLNPAAGQTTQRSQEVRRLSLVMGGGVRIANGVSVGKIEDVVLNDRGCIDYVIVVYQDKYVPIPWTVATVDYGQRIVTVDITEQRFAQVPTFTRTDFSVFSQPEFTQKVQSAFGGRGESTAAKAGTQAEPRKATKSEPEPKATKADAKAAKSEGKAEPKSARSETKAEPAKVAPQDKPKAESKEKPKGQPADKPKGESKDKPRN